MLGDKTFKIIAEGSKITIETWTPNSKEYKDVSEVIKEIRGFDANLAREMLTLKADRASEERAYRFFIGDDNRAGVMVFDIKENDQLTVRSFLKGLNMSPQGKKLEGVEAVADYYFENPQQIVGQNNSEFHDFNK